MMVMRSAALVLLLSVIALPAVAQPAKGSARPVVLFSIGDKDILADEFIYLYRKNHHAEKPGEYSKQKIQEYLDLFIKFKLKVEEARRRKMDTTSAFVREFSTYRAELRKPYLPDSRLIDSLVTLTYDRLKEEVKVSHILVSLTPGATPEDTLKAYRKIMGLRERIMKGEDFGAVALSSSDDQSARINKGDLGYFTAMQMVFPFENAAYAMAAGEVSMPVRTDFGYHLLYLADRRPSRGEVEVAHIMLRTGEDYDNEKAKNGIFDIYDQLQKGVPWEELCAQHGGAASGDNGCKLRPFGVGAMAMAGVPELEQIAFGLKEPGQISDPFQTQFGWHILKLESKIPLPSFETLAPSLKNRVSRDERAQLSKQSLQMKMRKEFGFSENPEVRQKVMLMADSSLTTGNWNPQAQAIAGEVLFTMQGDSYAVSDFLGFVQDHQQHNDLSPLEYLEGLYEQYVDEVQGTLVEEKIRKEHPEYAWLLNEYYEGILLFEIMEREVWNRASEDTVGQRRYYDDHTGDYRAQERIRATIFSSSSRPDIEELKSLAEKDDSVAMSEWVSKAKIREEAGAFEKADRPVLAKVSWNPGIHLSENNGLHYLVWIKSLLPPGIKTYQEARASVISDYQNALEQQWIAELKKKYPVRVSRKGKQFLEKELVKE